jgi:hypothetical protein
MVTSKKLFGQNDMIQSDEQVNVDGLIPATTSTAMNHLGSSSPISIYIPPDVIPVLLTIAPETVKYAGSGLVFVNQYGAGVTAQFHDAIIKAENFFQSHFTNSVTLNMSFDLKPIDDKNSDGSWKFSGFNTYNPLAFSYASLKNALTAHATTADDLAAVSSLPTSDPSGGKMFDVSVGMARILGLANPYIIATGGSGIDDTISLNSHLNWTFGDDAVGVLEHEISEGAMGRISELGVTNDGHWAPLDLFRYAKGISVWNGATILHTEPQHDYTGGKDGLATYFSVDGHTLLTQFHNSVDSTGKLDGFDLADWDNSVSGDAFGPGGPGAPGTVSSTDLKVMDILGWTPGSSIQQHLQSDFLAIMRSDLSADQASTLVSSINAGTLTESQFVDNLLSQAANTTIPAVAVEASMYGAVGTSAEVTLLATQFLPAQVANATSHGFNPLVYASETLGLAFAFGNEAGSTGFATTFGPSHAGMPNSTAGDAAFAAAASAAIFGSASTSNLVNVMEGFVSNWKTFFAHNGIPGVANANEAQIDLAARGTAWGDMVGVALDNKLGPLSGQVTNFLADATQGTAVYSASLSNQPNHIAFQAETSASGAAHDTSVQLTGVAAHIDHIGMI